MSAPTEVDICAEYFYNNFLKNKGLHISRKNFYTANIEELQKKHSDLWPYFTAIVKKLSEYKDIDYRDFISYVATNLNGFYHPKILLTYKAFATYNTRYNELKMSEQRKHIYKNVLKSINVVCKLCAAENIENIATFKSQYIYCKPSQMPKISQYIMSKEICPEFIVLCENVVELIKNWPADLKIEAGLNKSKLALTIKNAKEEMYIKLNRKFSIETVVDNRIKELLCQKQNQQQ